jgi:hypothetical protein
MVPMENTTSIVIFASRFKQVDFLVLQMDNNRHEGMDSCLAAHHSLNNVDYLCDMSFLRYWIASFDALSSMVAKGPIHGTSSDALLRLNRLQSFVDGCTDLGDLKSCVSDEVFLAVEMKLGELQSVLHHAATTLYEKHIFTYGTDKPYVTAAFPAK